MKSPEEVAKILMFYYKANGHKLPVFDSPQDMVDKINKFVEEMKK